MTNTRLNELQQVEEPLLRQLERMGWRVLRGDKYDPASTLREGFNEVIIEAELRAGLRQINPWLEDDQIGEVIHRITTPQSGSLLKANEEIFHLLIEGWSVAENRMIGEVSPSVRYIDFNYSVNNRFLAVSQFKVNVPGTDKHIIPDIVLFVNGLPLVVIECKAPDIADPMGEAIEQLLRYANRRGVTEGNERLFWYNLFQVATFRQVAKYSTITGEAEHYIEWKDPYPARLADIDTEGSQVVTSQHILTQGMLAKENLLDILHSYTVFAEDDKGRTIKIVPRYQQYRAARKIIQRLKEKTAPAEKSGTVWHTQGSGKSLTMMFLARAVFHNAQLNGYKVVFITDRTDLERQLGDTVRTSGYTLRVARSISQFKDLLRAKTPDLIMGMIHKFQENELRQEFPLLNDSERILVMIDEAHRSQYKMLGANLQNGLPNAVRIAFTGTPIDKTMTTFGSYIDRYSMRQAVDDGVTVEIIYEGRTHKGEVADRDALSRRFEDVFSAADSETRQLILDRYTWKAYLEAEEVICDKARDMMAHYLNHVFPNRFKAQVVAVSRLAAIRYQRALEQALREAVQRMEGQGDRKEDLVVLRRMKIEVVISGSNNDEPFYHPYTDTAKHEKSILSFKLPFGKESIDEVTGEKTSGDVGILVVQSMLITGFDAPIEQVMYLDDVIKEHNLLQAIARVNRVSANKSAGFVVDYVGLAHHLRKALAIFRDEDQDEIMNVVKNSAETKDSLRYAHSQLINFFRQYDLEDLNDLDACVDILVDEETRDDFINLMRDFQKALDRVLPDVEALKYAHDLKRLTWISESAKNRYRDSSLSIRDASRKIREIVDEYLRSKGVDPKIPPIPILDERFMARLRGNKNDHAKAQELEHAIREFVNEHAEEDPEFYERLGEKLERVLKEYRENWDRLAHELQEVLEIVRRGRQGEQNFGLDPRTELPFLALLKRDLFGTKELKELSEQDLELLMATTTDILELVRRETQQIEFWENYPAQKRLKSFILTHLLTAFRQNREFVQKRNQVAQQILELAMHLQFGKA